ncbi:hypothetical protein CcaCcLH18_09649 [Colletotrichum camelliae]|nr:hypothetical protein CcaCcLH18_09649 [Colletotrichum camelliae]
MDFLNPPGKAPWFDVGQTLQLLPHLDPPEPWGGAYPCPSASELKNIAAPYPRGFDPDAQVDEKVVAKVEVTRHLRVGLGSGPQVLLCKITKYPQTLAQPQMPFPRFTSDQKAKNEHLLDWIVLKVADGRLFPGGSVIPPWNNWELADQSHSRDSSALKFLYQKHQQHHTIMGSPYHVPAYFGTWVAEIPYENKAGEQKTRYVGAVAMEFIRGVSISDLCERARPKNRHLRSDDAEDEPGPNMARLIPRNDPDLFRGPEFAGQVMDVDSEAFRLMVLKRMLEGAVNTLHLGAEYTEMTPHNTFVSILDDCGSRTILPRVVYLDYSNFEVYEKTKYAADPEWPDQDPLTEKQHPIHPFERFATVHQCTFSVNFSGWYPAIWDKYPLLFDCWLGKTFGLIVEGPTYSIFQDRGDEPTRTLRKIVADYGATHPEPEVKDKDKFLSSLKDKTGIDVSAYMDWRTYENLVCGVEEDLQSLEGFLSRKRRRDYDDDEEGGEVVSGPSKRSKE